MFDSNVNVQPVCPQSHLRSQLKHTPALRFKHSDIEMTKHSIHLQEGFCHQNLAMGIFHRQPQQTTSRTVAGTAQTLRSRQKDAAPGGAFVAGCSAVWYRVTANE